MATKSYAFFAVSVLIILLLPNAVQGAYQLEYKIEVLEDGSATWSIVERGIGLQTSFDSFVESASFLVELAKAKAKRNMTASQFDMTVNVSGSYKVVKYRFFWDNFSEVESSRIEIGDVFEVDGFFSHLYGDGAVYIRYPSEYAVEAAQPPPSEHDRELTTLEWYGIEDFGVGQPKIVLGKTPANSSDSILLMVIGLLLFVGGGSISIYYFKFRRGKPNGDSAILDVQRALGMEDDEEKVLRLLEAAGGSLNQSIIVEKCGFSRSKASKLLTAMEGKGKIMRKEKGRKKIVTLRKNKGEKQH